MFGVIFPGILNMLHFPVLSEQHKVRANGSDLNVSNKPDALSLPGTPWEEVGHLGRRKILRAHWRATALGNKLQSGRLEFKAVFPTV